jgi:hypothetical protein
VLRRRELKTEIESFKLPTSESKRGRPKTESPILLVTEAIIENADTSPETTNHKTGLDLAGLRSCPLKLLLSVFSYLSVREFCACVAPVVCLETTTFMEGTNFRQERHFYWKRAWFTAEIITVT